MHESSWLSWNAWTPVSSNVLTSGAPGYNEHTGVSAAHCDLNGLTFTHMLLMFVHVCSFWFLLIYHLQGTDNVTPKSLLLLSPLVNATSKVMPCLLVFPHSEIFWTHALKHIKTTLSQYITSWISCLRVHFAFSDANITKVLAKSASSECMPCKGDAPAYRGSTSDTEIRVKGNVCISTDEKIFWRGI